MLSLGFSGFPDSTEWKVVSPTCPTSRVEWGITMGRHQVLLGLVAFKAGLGRCLGTLKSRVVVLCSLTCWARKRLPSPWLYRYACLLPHWADQQAGTLLWTNTSLPHHSNCFSSLARSQALGRPPPLPTPNTLAFSFCRESLSTVQLALRIGEGVISMVLLPFPSEWNVQWSLFLTYNGGSHVAFFHGGSVLPMEQCPSLHHDCLLTAISGMSCTPDLSCLT